MNSSTPKTVRPQVFAGHLNRTLSKTIEQLVQDLFNGNPESTEKLWNLATTISIKCEKKAKTHIRETNRSLSDAFQVPVFAKIQCFIGQWQIGALSLERKGEIQIFTGRTENNIQESHTIKHELLHHYLRKRMHKSLIGSEAEEFFVQHLTVWELNPDIQLFHLNSLKKAKEALESKQWKKMSSYLRDIQCQL